MPSYVVSSRHVKISALALRLSQICTQNSEFPLNCAPVRLVAEVAHCAPLAAAPGVAARAEAVLDGARRREARRLRHRDVQHRLPEVT